MARYIDEDGDVREDNPLPLLFGVLLVVFMMIGLVTTGLLGYTFGGPTCVLNFLWSALLAGGLSIYIVRRMNRPKVEKPPRPCRNCGAPIPSLTRECPKCGKKRLI